MTTPSASTSAAPPAGALAPPPGTEPLYEARFRITSVTEYGAALAEVLAGAPAPPEGLRLDVAFEGTVSGARLAGSAAGVDYVQLRADGRAELHVHARLATSDGANVALIIEGVGMPRGDGLVELRETVRLHSSDPRYRWVNPLVVLGIGTADFGLGTIEVRAFAS